jgi:two-component system sensor histidine kinase/response regulator
VTSPLLDVKVLLVDDLEENLLAMKALLRRDGVELLTARSGREALELLLRHDVALALVDVQMPEMDGFELAELMRGTERTSRVPLIFITAGSRDVGRVFRGYEVGAVDFLFKPVDPVLLGHKLTTFVELHRQRVEQKRQAEEFRRMLELNELFVAAVSHDLRSPLATVITGLGILERELAEPGPLRTMARVRSSARRMAAMLDQLNDLARARLGGGMPIEPSEIDFARLCRRVVEELRVAHPERALDLVCDGESMTGSWDEARLAQVLTNLIENALRHGTPGATVQVHVHCGDDTLTVEVHNPGEIPPSVQPQLFEPFRRGTGGSHEGLGLGLFIVRQILLAHGATIRVSSSGEEGTTFVFELPRKLRR